MSLHACGDLSPTMLRVFHSAGSAVDALVNVGCCYHKLTEAHEGPLLNFPMSAHVATLSVRLPACVRELACHSAIAYAARLQAAAAGDSKALSALELHCWRAVLELLLTRHTSCGADTKEKVAMRGAPKVSFGAYVLAGWQRAGLPEPSPADLEAMCDEAAPLLKQSKRVVIVYVLRLLLAPLWEALILLDRRLYLQEHGYASALVPLFDPSLSPRSYAVVAIKRRFREGNLDDLRCLVCDDDKDGAGEEDAENTRRWGHAV